MLVTSSYVVAMLEDSALQSNHKIVHVYIKARMKSICVIGGGIAGLYYAYEYNKLHPNTTITILEKGSRLGGRIYTIHKHDVRYEAGAGRMSSNHVLLMRLVKELGLEDSLIPMEKSKVYIKDSKVISFNEEVYINRLQELKKTRPRKELKSKTLTLFMRENIVPSICDDIVHAFGYNSEFDSTNAYDALENMKHDYVSDVDYYFLQGGYGSMVIKLAHVLEKKGVIIKKMCDVTDVRLDDTLVVYVKDKKEVTERFDHIVFCVTKPDLVKFDCLSHDVKLMKTLQRTSIRPLYRIYAKFPNASDGKVWFAGMHHTCTNNALRNIIPISEKYGLIMLSYTDGTWAESWKQFESKHDLKDSLLMHLRLLFPKKNIPEPDWIEPYYWSCAAHYPQPYHSQYVNRDKRYTICGEVVAKSHFAWVEGALRSVHDVLKPLRHGKQSHM